MTSIEKCCIISIIIFVLSINKSNLCEGVTVESEYVIAKCLSNLVQNASTHKQSLFRNKALVEVEGVSNLDIIYQIIPLVDSFDEIFNHTVIYVSLPDNDSEKYELSIDKLVSLINRQHLNWTMSLYKSCVISPFDTFNVEVYAMFVKNIIELERQINEAKCDPVSWTPNVLFVIVLLRFDDNENSLQSYFEILWKYLAFKSVILTIKDRLQLFSADPWDYNNNCGKTVKKIIKHDKCVETVIPVIKKNIFPGCNLIISGRDTVPFCFLNKREEFQGIDSDLIRLVAERSNLSLTWNWRPSPQAGVSVENAHAYYQNVSRNEIDAAIGGSVIQQDKFFYISYGRSHGTQYLYWYVAKQGKEPQWKSIYAMFEMQTWIAICAAFFSCILIIQLNEYFNYTYKGEYILKNNGSFTSLFIVFSILLERSVRIAFAKSTTTRFIFFIIIFYSYAISIMYSSLLHSTTINPPSVRDINSIDELIKSNLSISISDTNVKFVKNIVAENVRKAIKTFIKNTGLVDGARQLNEFKNFTLIERDTAMDYILAHNSYRLHRINFKIAAINNALVIPKGSLYYDRLNYFITSSIEYGFNKKWLLNTFFDEENYEKVKIWTEESKTPKSLKVEHLAVVFFLIFIGYSLSVLSFICEICVYNFMKKVQNRKQQ